jgi:hypothetical protein
MAAGWSGHWWRVENKAGCGNRMVGAKKGDVEIIVKRDGRVKGK